VTVAGVCTTDAVKVALVAPADTVTELGTLRMGLLSEIATVAPPLGAGLLRFTVQMAEPGGLNADGLQLIEAMPAPGDSVTVEVGEPPL